MRLSASQLGTLKEMGKNKSRKEVPARAQQGDGPAVDNTTMYGLVAVIIGLMGMILLGLQDDGGILQGKHSLPQPAHVPTDSMLPSPPDAVQIIEEESDSLVSLPTPSTSPPPPAPPTVNCGTLQSEANTLYRNGHFQAAVDKLIACTELVPDDTAALWDVGVMLSQLRDYPNALSWMQAAIESGTWRDVTNTSGCCQQFPLRGNTMVCTCGWAAGQAGGRDHGGLAKYAVGVCTCMWVGELA